MLRPACTNVQTCLSLPCLHIQCSEALYCGMEQDTLYEAWVDPEGVQEVKTPLPHEKSQEYRIP